MFAWIVLFNPPLYMDMAMLKVTQKYISEFFWHSAHIGMVYKLVWVGNKSAWVGTQVAWPSF